MFTPKRHTGNPKGPIAPKGAFHILSLSGGGYLSYYTALVLAGLEQRSGMPLRNRFDMIAGTSAGGILATAVALGVPMTTFAQTFKEDGAALFGTNVPNKSKRQAFQDFMAHMFKARYNSADLATILEKIMPEDFLIRHVGHRLLLPTYNMTKGVPHSLRTHYLKDKSHAGDWTLKDACLASAAAPLFFPLHKVNNSLYADGALYANSPDLLALHDATLMGVKDKNISILSIGTASRHASANPENNASWGLRDWTRGQTIIKTVMNAQQLSGQRQVRQRLGTRYLQLDGDPPPDMAKQIGLDIATPEAQHILEGLSQSTLQTLDPRIAQFIAHKAQKPILGPGLISPYPWADLKHAPLA